MITNGRGQSCTRSVPTSLPPHRPAIACLGTLQQEILDGFVDGGQLTAVRCSYVRSGAPPAAVFSAQARPRGEPPAVLRRGERLSQSNTYRPHTHTHTVYTHTHTPFSS